MPSQIGRIGDPQAAFWNIAQFLARDPYYSRIPLAQLLVIQRAIKRGKYCCMTDGKSIQAAATWLDVDKERLLQTYPNYTPQDSEPTNAVLVTCVAGADPASVKSMIAHLAKTFAGQQVYWDRHQGKGLEHMTMMPG